MRDLNTGECDLRNSFISVPSSPLKISHGSTLWLDLPGLIPRFFLYKSHAHLFVVHVKSLIESLERFLGKGTAVHFYSTCIVSSSSSVGFLGNPFSQLLGHVQIIWFAVNFNEASQ